MQIGSIVVGAVIALIAGVGSVSADELHVADTTVAPDTPFAMLDGIATEQMSVQELAATRGENSGRFLIFATSGATEGRTAVEPGSQLLYLLDTGIN